MHLTDEQLLNFSPNYGEVVPALYAMKAHVEIQARLHAFLTLLLGNAERGGSRFGPSTTRETAPRTLRSWVGLGAGLDTLEKRSASLLRLQPNNFARIRPGGMTVFMQTQLPLVWYLACKEL